MMMDAAGNVPERVQGIEKRLDALGASADARFNQVDARFNQVDAAFADQRDMSTSRTRNWMRRSMPALPTSTRGSPRPMDGSTD